MALFSLFCQEEDPFSEERHVETAAAAAIEPFSDDLIASLVSGERRSFPSLDRTYIRSSARKDAILWVTRTCSRHSFGAATVLLAADYLDRCFLSPSPCLLLQEDKPWMKQLSAVACLSLAAKVEETCVPFLVDLQISPHSSSSSPEQETEVSGFLFEAKTIKRMELLVLSTLGWKMTPATAHSFLQCIVSKLGSCNDPLEILRISEAILVAVVVDWRWVRFPPSVWAAAALMQANAGAFDELQQLMEVLGINKEKLEECHGIIVEIMGNGGDSNRNKRKKSHYYYYYYYCSSDEPPPSPNGVVSSCFSYESSSSMDSWPMWPSSVSSSPEPPAAKRAQFD